MVRRKGEGSAQEMRKQDVDAILAAAREFVRAVGQANLQVHFKSKARLDNGPIVDSIKIYCKMISGKELMEVQAHSTGRMMAVSFPDIAPPPLHNGTVRLQHKPHIKTFPRYLVILPHNGTLKLEYYNGLPNDLPLGGLFADQAEAEFWAKVFARAAREVVERQG